VNLVSADCAVVTFSGGFSKVKVSVFAFMNPSVSKAG